MALRSALGATRLQLARQAIIESLLLSLAGAIASCALAERLLRLFLALAPPSIPYLARIHLNLRIIGFTILLSLLCSFILRIVPTFQRPGADMLSSRSLHPTSTAALRQSLTIAQIAASIILLAGATLLLHSFWNLQRQQLGMRTDRTLTVGITLGIALGPQKYGTNQQEFAFFQQLQKRLCYGPGVSLVAVTDSLPPAPNHSLTRFSSIVVAGTAPTANENGGSVTYHGSRPTTSRLSTSSSCKARASPKKS